MKQVRLIAIFAMMVFGSVLTFAQEIAHIDTQAVLEAMPQYKKAETDLEAIGKKHQAQLEQMDASLKQLEQAFQNDIKGKSQEEAQKIVTEKKYQEKGQELQQKMVTYRQAAQEEMVNKEKALLDPIEKRVMDAISSVAAKKGIKYVLPAGVTIYKNGGYDLFNDVKKELGL